MKQINKLKSIFLVTVLCVTMSGCHNDEAEECLDCIGAFTCEINGKEWKPNCDSGTILWGCSSIRAGYDKETSRFSLRVTNQDDNSRFLLGCYDFKPGINPVKKFGREFIDYNRGNCGPYHLIRENENYFDILSVDTLNRIIEATFKFDMVNECDLTDTLRVRNGYFHLGFSS